MVCARCIKTVTEIFGQEGIGIVSVRLGVVETSQDPLPVQLAGLRERLQQNGFELLDDQKSRLIEKIRNEIIQLVHYGELDELKVNLSAYLSSHLHRDYHYLSNLFSAVEGTTIEQYFILQKIEKVKELLFYGEQTISEIAFLLGYSSAAHLSNQFKRITGLTPGAFKKLKGEKRNPLDKL